MIDSKTGKRIEVNIDEEYGPFIRVMSRDAAELLKYFFDLYYFVRYWDREPEDQGSSGGFELFFGKLIVPAKLQTILDDVEVVVEDGEKRLKFKGVLLSEAGQALKLESPRPEDGSSSSL